MQLLINWYLTQTKLSNLIYDERQSVILQQLDTFITDFSTKWSIQRLWQRNRLLGIYLYGPIGCGKSMIIDELFQQIPEKQKTRIHFHQFMQDIHQKLANLKDTVEPLNAIAKDLRRKYRIIFLDEMLVSDIASAMILKNLFFGLFKYGVYLVTSSNFAPNQLYPNGLMRERFLSAIELIEQRLQILNLTSDKDYRRQSDIDNKMFIIGSNHSHEKLAILFDQFAVNNQTSSNDKIIIQSRPICYVKKSARIIWFKFDIICGKNRSELDYLDLCNEFDYLVIEDISPIPAEDKDIARRLTYLVDILYDNHKKIILSASCSIEQIYIEGEWVVEFGRTISRLHEMQTQEYLNKKISVDASVSPQLNNL